MAILLGSLFDGIGGFALAALKQGIIPVWASEIEPSSISITKKHFPFFMIHFGDITKINGKDITPVDIISAGSPCQDLSIAGQRRGLEGERSGLFLHAIRIIRQMRHATNSKYPRFIVWENVPGAFSSNNCNDFKTVLEEIAEAEIPMPKSGKWAKAGMVRGNGFSLAWRVLDAQYWGVPQRRKRIFLVADFGGERAGEILFKPESLSGDFKESAPAREGTAGNVENCFGGTGGRKLIFPTVANCLLAKSNLSYRLDMDNLVCFQANASAADSAPSSTKLSPPLRTKSQMAVCFGPGGDSEIAHTIRAEPSKADKPSSTTYVVYPQVTGTLCASGAGLNRPGGQGNETDLVITYAIQGNIIDRSDTTGANGKGINENVCFTLNTVDRHAVAAIDCRNLMINSKVSGTLQAKPNGGYSLNYQNPVRVGYRVRRLTPLECERLMGFPDNWTEGLSDTKRYKTLGNSVAIPCAEYIFKGIVQVLT